MTLSEPPFSWLLEPSMWQMALPVGLSLAGLGIALARGRQRAPGETLANVATYAAVLLVDIFLANAVMILAFTWIGHAVPWKLPVNLATFALAFVIVDFCHYWRHRISHKVHLLWCVHGVHHSSEELNFSTVLRLSPVEPVYNWAFFTPALLVGIPGAVVLAAVALNFQYQLYFVHNGDVGKLPFLDTILGTPSNHRVHHAVNPEYLDRNFGGVLMIWDHLFGTYVPEVASPRFGIVKPIGTRNPFLITFRPFARMREDFARRGWRALFLVEHS